ncbi:MAG TPA: ABC transporter permease [Candidatus Acidoferrum sp.]|nr:ABC transporter permease [Candidatus Acidoferrum sp.]
MKNLIRRDRVERDLDAEVRSYADLLEEEKMSRGMGAIEAHRSARMDLGGPEQLKEEIRAARAGVWLETLWQDLRFGSRTLRKNPGFTAVAVLTLALGIGANTAIFSVVRAVLLQPLPFPDSSRIVMIRGTIAKLPTAAISYPDYLDQRTQNHSFSEMGAYGRDELILNGIDSSDRVRCEITTDSYFKVLDVPPAMGRTFLPEENLVPGAYAVAVIGDGLWRRAYGADPNVLGKPIRLNGILYTIVGVMPRGFLGLTESAEVWIPMMMHDAMWPPTSKFSFLTTRDIHWLRTVARLKPGVSLQAAQVDMDGVTSSLSAAFPKYDKDRGVLISSARDVFVGASRRPLFMLLGAVAFVLLIACANVANLLLSRMNSRQREFAVRAALGAPRSRLFRQMLVECLLLASGGAVLSIGIVASTLKLLMALLPVSFPSFVSVHIDREVLVFATLLAIVTGFLLSLIPAWSANSQHMQESLKDAARGGSGGRRGRRLHGVLVVLEVASSIVLLAGAGLLIKSMAQLIGGDPGFRPDHLLTMRFYVPDRPYAADGKNRFGPSLADYVSALPGVESAAVTFIDPFIWGGIGRMYTLENRPAISSAQLESITYQEVGPGYLHAMRIPLLSGREFTVQDSLDHPRVVMVNQAFARTYWPGENAIGKRMKYGPADSTGPWMEVVGVTGDTKFDSLRQDPSDSPVVYGPLLQSEVIINMSLIVRTKTDPAAMIPGLREAISKYDSAVPLYNIATLEDRMRENAAVTRSYAMLLALFAALALALCAIGIYGVIAYWVSQRTREIGVRMALGSGRAGVFRLVAGEGLRLTIIGLACGFVMAVFLNRLLVSLLYKVQPFDFTVYAGITVILLLVSVVASFMPARRAMNVDPMIALRYE